MGADTSRLYSPTEESIDAYISRGGARLVSRTTTSTTVDIAAGADDVPGVRLFAGGHASVSYHRIETVCVLYS